jgi:hypothetical protein
MKYRKDFVTNSSSSSYVCEICGNENSGFDCSCEELGFAVCEHEHTFCIDHILDYGDEEIDLWYVPEEYCPICQFQEISSEELNAYKNILLKKTDEELKQLIKNGFKDYDDFHKFLAKNKR